MPHGYYSQENGLQILVTGASGYLGGRVVEYLSQMGLSVKVGGREIFAESVGANTALVSACQGVSAVIHLAAMNAQACANDPEAALQVNGLNSLRLIKAAERSGVSKFIYFSTAHVYGSPLEGKLNEESLPRPLHPYSITHRLAEDYLLEANARGKLSGVVFRLTNAVGSPVNKEANCWMLVANDLCKQVVVDKKMLLHSSSMVERDYIPISSVIKSVYLVLKSRNLKNGIYNLSSGRTYSLMELTDLIADRSEKLLGYRPDIEFMDSNSNKKNNKLEISNEKLKLSGFEIEKSLVAELDHLLLNCNKWFRG